MFLLSIETAGNLRVEIIEGRILRAVGGVKNYSLAVNKKTKRVLRKTY